MRLTGFHRLLVLAVALHMLSGPALSMGGRPAPPPSLLSREQVQVLSRIVTQSNSVGDVIVLDDFKAAFSWDEQPFLYFKDGQLTRFIRKGYHLLYPTVVDADTVFVVARKMKDSPQADDKNYSVESCNIPQRKCTTVISNDEFNGVEAYFKYGKPENIFHIGDETYVIFKRRDEIYDYDKYTIILKSKGNTVVKENFQHPSAAGFYKAKMTEKGIIFNSSVSERSDHNCKKSQSCFFLYHFDKKEFGELSYIDNKSSISEVLDKSNILRISEASIRFGYFIAGGRVLFFDRAPGFRENRIVSCASGGNCEIVVNLNLEMFSATMGLYRGGLYYSRFDKDGNYEFVYVDKERKTIKLFDDKTPSISIEIY